MAEDRSWRENTVETDSIEVRRRKDGKQEYSEGKFLEKEMTEEEKER